MNFLIQLQFELNWYENYCLQEVESEGETVVKDNRPDGDWPSEGCITFRKYKMRYRENLPLALNSVSFDVLPREKIGIVGRSGSGNALECIMLNFNWRKL